MNEIKINLDKINKDIADRSNVFYWQTDRLVTPEQAGNIWSDRHKYFNDIEITERVNSIIGEDKLIEIESLNLDTQNNLGNVNSVRTGRLQSGREVIIRLHPKGIINGYFYAEAAAALKAKKAGLPSYDTLAIHNFEGGDDFAFQVCEKLQGTAITKWLDVNPNDEDNLLLQIGRMMALLHKIKVDGFGPFNNEKAKHGEIIGLHDSFAEAIRAGLDFNLDVLTKEGVLTNDQKSLINRLFSPNNKLLIIKEAILVHNDFADWNLLTDGKVVTGILDWDECVGGDPVSDIACWSTFFNPDRLNSFLEGYFQVSSKPEDFNDKFELLRLRYIISKMTLRLRRYSWDPSESIRERIDIGRQHLDKSLKYFNL